VGGWTCGKVKSNSNPISGQWFIYSGAMTPTRGMFYFWGIFSAISVIGLFRDKGNVLSLGEDRSGVWGGAKPI